MWDCQILYHASNSQVIIVNQLKSIYNSRFKDSHPRPINTYFLILLVMKLVACQKYLKFIIASFPVIYKKCQTLRLKNNASLFVRGILCF